MLAMTRGAKVRARLEEHFGGQPIADLPLPFFCCSSDLTEGKLRVHERGDLAWALRASIALPGVLPPVTDGQAVLVDGGVLRNLPTDVMRAQHAGPLLAVDVSTDHGVTADDIALPPSMLRWFASGEWRRGPPVVSVLLRSATVTAGRELAAARALADVFIAPELDGVEIRDWKAFDRAAAAGQLATERALARLGRPVAHARMRS
jgi:NTE family protein